MREEIDIGVEQVNEWEWALDIPDGGGYFAVDDEDRKQFLIIAKSGTLWPYTAIRLDYDPVGKQTWFKLVKYYT